MSKRFFNWAESWIEENILPGVNSDLESHDARAKRLMEEMFAEAVAANFAKPEIEEEWERLTPMVLDAASDETEFDFETFRLKYELAQEMGDGD